MGAGGMLIQPWVPPKFDPGCPGPLVPGPNALRQGASCRKYPPSRNNMAYCDHDGGYQYGEPGGQGEMNSYGWYLPRTV